MAKFDPQLQRIIDKDGPEDWDMYYNDWHEIFSSYGTYNTKPKYEFNHRFFVWLMDTYIGRSTELDFSMFLRNTLDYYYKPNLEEFQFFVDVIVTKQKWVKQHKNVASSIATLVSYGANGEMMDGVLDIIIANEKYFADNTFELILRTVNFIDTSLNKLNADSFNDLRYYIIEDITVNAAYADPSVVYTLLTPEEIIDLSSNIPSIFRKLNPELSKKELFQILDTINGAWDANVNIHIWAGTHLDESFSYKEVKKYNMNVSVNVVKIVDKETIFKKPVDYSLAVYSPLMSIDDLIDLVNESDDPGQSAFIMDKVIFTRFITEEEIMKYSEMIDLHAIRNAVFYISPENWKKIEIDNHSQVLYKDDYHNKDINVIRKQAEYSNFGIDELDYIRKKLRLTNLELLDVLRKLNLQFINNKDLQKKIKIIKNFYQ